MSDTKISDFLQVDGGDISNITAIAAVGTASGGAAGQNVKISGDELETSLALDVTQLTKNIGANDQVLKIVNNAPAWAASTDDDTTYTIGVPAATTDVQLLGSDLSDTEVTFTAGDVIDITRTSGTELTVDHEDVTRTDTTSSLSPVAGGTFTCIDSVTTSTEGHITAANVKTVTLPAAGGGGIDFSNIIITGAGNIKADLTQSSQTQYGQAITVKANGAISNGDVVVSDYSGGQVRGLKPTTLPTQNTITGVAIEDIADGQSGKVLVYGYATANYRQFTPPTNSAPNLELDSISNGNTLVLTPGVTQPFSDSGGPGSPDYSSNQTYTHTFDAGAGSIVNMITKSFEFEGVGSRAWDRLGF